MKSFFSLLLTLLIASGVIANAHANDLPPDVLVRNVTNEVLEIVRQDKDIQSGNTQKTLQLVETKVLPHFNFQRMTRLALGRDGRLASPDQLKVLVDEFRNLLVRTYAKALTEYREQQIAFKPFSMPVTAAEARVKTEIHQSGGKPVPLDYYLEKTPDGWKVYDLEVGGVSLVTNYRSSFSQEIKASGVDGLIRSLQTKNKAAETAAAK
jgi:phospholipid transport system substrate-binding protein